MTALGDQMDVIALIAVTAIPGLITERGLRLPEKLDAEELPHLFLYDPSEEIELLEHQQERIVATLNLLFVTRGDTQEELLEKLESFRSNLKADYTLNGLVIGANFASVSIDEHPEKDEKIAGIVIQTSRERF